MFCFVFWLRVVTRGNNEGDACSRGTGEQEAVRRGGNCFFPSNRWKSSACDQAKCTQTLQLRNAHKTIDGSLPRDDALA